jgi:hypothetical protein
VKLRIAALLILLATAAAGVVPCPTPLEAPATLQAASARTAPPSLLPACHCGCKERPSAAGVATAPGLALFTAAVEIEPPLGSAPHPAAPLLATSLLPDPPEPVPLVVA